MYNEHSEPIIHQPGHAPVPVTRNEIVSLPQSLQQSIRERLSQAEALLSRGRPEEADAVLSEVELQIARASPELGALLVGARMGYSQLTLEQVDRDRKVTRTEKKVLGMVVSSEETVVENYRSVTRTARFS